MQLSIPDLDLRHIYESGQCFRWEPLGQDTYRIPAFGRTLTVRQTDGVFDFSCGAGEFDALWRSYFDLDTDYAAIKARVAPRDAYLQAAVAYGWGMRILRQDLWEVIGSFIVSQNNNIPRIRGLVERLCALCGSPLENGQHAFPTPEQLAACTEEQLATLRAGWRAGYLADAAQKVLGPLPGPEALTALPLADAQAALMTIHGVGPKVADCTLLYGLGRWDAFPLDVWMKRAMAQLFPRGIPVCCRGTQGIAQQFIFAYARAHLPKGETPKQAGGRAARRAK